MSEIFKALPSNITKDHLLQAIAKIDEEGIPTAKIKDLIGKRFINKNKQ